MKVTTHTTKLGRTIYAQHLKSGYVVLTMKVARYNQREQHCATLGQARLIIADWINAN